MAQQRSKPEPLPSIEGLRLIASVAVIFTHFAPYALGYEPLRGGLTIFVDLFFVISGIVITSAYGARMGTARDYGVYLQRRFARLYPLHFATMMAYVAIALLAWSGLFSVRNPDRYDVGQLGLYFTLTQSWFGNGKIAWNAVSWSISAELAAYIVFPLLLAAIRNRLVIGALLALALLSVGGVLAQVLAEQDVTRLASKYAWLRAIPSFAAGIWLACQARRLYALGRYGAQILLYGGSVMLAAKLALDLSELAGLVAAWMIVAGAYSCDLQRVPTAPGVKLISDQGRLTYSLYLIHPLVATTWLAFVAPRLIGSSSASMWVAVAIGTVLTFILAHVSLVWFEEPWRNRLSRPWLGRRRPAAPPSGAESSA